MLEVATFYIRYKVGKEIINKESKTLLKWCLRLIYSMQVNQKNYFKVNK